MSRILPGATIGIIGGGQLGRMIALEARRMGYVVGVLDPDGNGPLASVANFHIAGRIDDLAAARELADRSDVITIETEHIPADLLEDLESRTRVRPRGRVLREIQDRLRQRRFLESHGLPQPKYAAISGVDDLTTAASTVGFPAVLKTRHDGYDGKGQSRVGSIAELRLAWETLSPTPCILEAFIPFEKEISTILARDPDGNIRFYPIAENRHRNHILHTTQAPASIAPELVAQAEQLGASIAEALGHVGMMAVELFVTRDHQLLVNEVAPRTHNSGHYTFGGCSTSQFEQHVRAICGLPLGDPTQLRPAVMINLLGDLWQDGRLPWDALFASPSARLHLYDKTPATIGRKMGHLLVLEETLERALAAASEIESILDAPASPQRGKRASAT